MTVEQKPKSNLAEIQKEIQEIDLTEKENIILDKLAQVLAKLLLQQE